MDEGEYTLRVWEVIGAWVSGLGTMSVAAIVASITYRQYKIAKLQALNSLFDKRYEIYNEIQTAINDIRLRRSIKYEDINKLQNAMNKSWSIFGSDVQGYIDLLLLNIMEIDYKIRSKDLNMYNNKAEALYGLSYADTEIMN